MKNLIFYFVIFSILLISCNTQSSNDASVTKPDFSKLETEAKELLVISMDLFKAKDLEGLVGRFTEDGTLKIPDAPLVSGKTELRENYKSTLQLEDFNINLGASKVEISEDGTMAYMLSDFTVSFSTPGGPFNDSGTSLFVLKRVEDQWKIASEVLSSGPKN